MLRTIMALVAASALTTPAGAVSFADIAEGGTFQSTLGERVGFEGSWAAVVGAADAGIIDNGVTIFATAGASDPYFDEYSGGKPAGLGVCKTTASFQCAGSADDNLRFEGGEYLDLMFDRKVEVTSLSFRDGDHNVIAAGSFLLDGIVRSITDGLADLTGLGALDGMRIAATAETPFIYAEQATVAPIPLPAPASLLIGGVAALAMAGRRKPATA